MTSPRPPHLDPFCLRMGRKCVSLSVQFQSGSRMFLTSGSANTQTNKQVLKDVSDPSHRRDRHVAASFPGV